MRTVRMKRYKTGVGCQWGASALDPAVYEAQDGCPVMGRVKVTEIATGKSAILCRSHTRQLFWRTARKKPGLTLNVPSEAALQEAEALYTVEPAPKPAVDRTR